MTIARRFLVRGTVQGVGFRPFVARLAARHSLFGWVLNANDGVDIHAEGSAAALEAFARELTTQAPAAAQIDALEHADAVATGCETFSIRTSDRARLPTLRISPDLPVCAECLEEMFDPGARRYGYAYTNCTACGPRFSIIRALPYDRARTTMADWPLCTECEKEYQDPANRRFHAEPIACPRCGPRYRLVCPGGDEDPGQSPIARTAALLRQGAIVAVKGIGGYHLACDARNESAVRALRARKYRKARPFAVMASTIAVARAIVQLDEGAEELITSPARPIVLAPARVTLPDVAPNHRELGVMLPYAPIHYLLFAAGAPDVIVMTSANRASEPIAVEDADAFLRLGGIADAFLVGERPIARRVDDSVMRPDVGGPLILRRGRGSTPSAVARVPGAQAILAVGADLKNAITLVVDGVAMTSQHIGDLDHLSALEVFRATIEDFLSMYELRPEHVLLAHDLHPSYASTQWALEFGAGARVAIQHHRAHVVSVLAERQAYERRVVGLAFDGTGYGDDGTIWGGEFFAGSVAEGLGRVGSLRPFALPGGDACAQYPVQAAAGLLLDTDAVPDLTVAPFMFPRRYGHARQLAQKGLRTFTSTSAGRLFDSAAALLGFTRAVDHEGQAAVWLEQLAWRGSSGEALPFEVRDRHLDFRPALRALIDRRRRGDDDAALARAFHESFAAGLVMMANRLCEEHAVDTIVVSGGTFQNALLLHLLRVKLPRALQVWSNTRVPPNDAGISLGQAAAAAIAHQ